MQKQYKWYSLIHLISINLVGRTAMNAPLSQATVTLTGETVENKSYELLNNQCD